MKFIISLILLYPFISHSGNKGIYQKDSRIEASLHKDQRIKELSKSVAAVFYSIHVKKKDNYRELAYGIYGELENFCTNVPFQGQPSTAYCSAFLVAPNIMVTAGHCINKKYHCDSSSFVFDYNIENITGPFPPQDRLRLKSSSVYACKRIIARAINKETNEDYSILEIKEKITDRTPLKIRSFGKITRGTPVFMIGTPSGLPLKVSEGANVFENSSPLFFRTNLDAFHNSSGSPVFNQNTLEVEGILVRGRKDYESYGGCKEIKKCSIKDCPKGEEVTRILSTGLKKILSRYRLDQ